MNFCFEIIVLFFLFLRLGKEKKQEKKSLLFLLFASCDGCCCPQFFEVIQRRRLLNADEEVLLRFLLCRVMVGVNIHCLVIAPYSVCRCFSRTEPTGGTCRGWRYRWSACSALPAALFSGAVVCSHPACQQCLAVQPLPPPSPARPPTWNTRRLFVSCLCLMFLGVGYDAFSRYSPLNPVLMDSLEHSRWSGRRSSPPATAAASRANLRRPRPEEVRTRGRNSR